MKSLPYARHFIEKDDIDAVAKVLNSDFLTTGPITDMFEREIAAFLGVSDFVVCNSGTSALHLAAMAMGLGAGDKAIVPALTFVATANAVRMTGAEVVLADVNPATGLMDAVHFEQAILKAGSGVKAVFPVHLTGQCADMPAIKALADKHGIKIISDACHGFGGVHSDEASTPLGGCRYEDMACFSFHPVKSISMGEGGGVSTNDPELAKHMRRLRSHGISRLPTDFKNKDEAFSANGHVNPWYYECLELGYNFRAPDVLCALALSQFRKIDRFMGHRRNLATEYDKAFEAIDPRIKPNEKAGFSQSAYHLYALRVDFAALGKDRAEVMAHLLAKGIGTQVHYIPVHYHPAFSGITHRQNFPGAEDYYAKTLSIPMHMDVALEDVIRVKKAFESLL